jgi:hypothetical protein
MVHTRGDERRGVVRSTVCTGEHALAQRTVMQKWKAQRTMADSCLAPQLYFLDSVARFFEISLTSSSLLPLESYGVQQRN